MNGYGIGEGGLSRSITQGEGNGGSGSEVDVLNRKRKGGNQS